jgi:Fic family protein
MLQNGRICGNVGRMHKKMAVLRQLSLESEPIGLPQLLEKLGAGFAERTVRRYLAEDGTVKKIGRKRGTKYYIADSPWSHSGQALLLEENLEWFSQESLPIIEQVRRPICLRTPVAYNEDWVDSYEPNQTFYIPLHHRKELYKEGKRSKHNAPAGTYAHQVFNRLLIDLSYNSSRLEGNSYSMLETKQLLLQGKSAEGKLDEEKAMILNHKEAIRYLVDTAHRIEVSFETICTLHFLLSDGLMERYHSGIVRDYGVFIGQSTYMPCEGQKRLQIRLESILKKAALIEDPYEQSLFLLIHISYLQAFGDVNKRTARLSANISLIKNNLVPLSFNDVEKDSYISAMIAVYELQDIRPILDLYLFSYRRTCFLYNATVETFGFDEVRIRLRQERRTLIREIILQQLTNIPMEKYIASESLKVAPEDRRFFVEDTLEDLNSLNKSSLVGLGITVEEFEKWFQLLSADK